MTFLTLSTIVLAISRRQLLNTVAVLPNIQISSYNSPMSSSKYIKFYGDVDVESCNNLIANLITADEATEEEYPIHLHIQSFGGDLMPMFYVLDCIDSIKSPVWTYVDGFAASAASLLSVYGKKRLMTKRSFVLMHELQTASQGTYSEVMTDIAHSEELMQMMCNVYETKTVMQPTEIKDLLMKDTWLNAQKCMKRGIVDTII